LDDPVGQVPAISIELHGVIPDQVAQRIQREIESCYRVLTTTLPEAVTLSIFDTLEQWQSYAAQRRAEAGVPTAGEEGFLTTHEAWEGYPRLNVCLERLQAHPEVVQKGALQQVVAHSVLHGRPDYYRFPIPSRFIDYCEQKGVELEVLQQILYFVAIAVKGLEAASLLVEHGYVRGQTALALYQLQVDKDDITLWKMARWDPRARLLYLSAQLKPLLYLQPLLPHAPRLSEAGRTMLAHLPPEEIDRLDTLVEFLNTERSGDTHKDVAIGLGLVLNWIQ
jgi:hypothetical protein